MGHQLYCVNSAGEPQERHSGAACSLQGGTVARPQASAQGPCRVEDTRWKNLCSKLCDPA